MFVLQVQAVLLLLGGQELPHEVPGMPLADNVNHRVSNVNDNFSLLMFVFQLISLCTLSY